ncbi:egl nine-like protein [Lasius niger]|uniref:Egl nine-like protein n=1 Tax=Lasius niger TaxID=67767 RepID=A0A0J7K0F2_LASNI|nr:egl nine-like protein [Lasius niger]
MGEQDRKMVEKLERELRVARAEVESLRTLAFPTGQSPPHKKVREPDDTREIGTQMEVGEIISPDSAAVPLPVSPVLGTIRKINRGCSPTDWGVDVAMASSYSGRDVGTETSQRVTGGVTSAESSFMALLEGVFAGQEASQAEINRLRNEVESLSRDIVSLAGKARKASILSIALNKETKKKRAKKKRKDKPESKAILLVVSPVSEAVGELSRLSVSESIRTPIVEET